MKMLGKKMSTFLEIKRRRGKYWDSWTENTILARSSTKHSHLDLSDENVQGVFALFSCWVDSCSTQNGKMAEGDEDEESFVNLLLHDETKTQNTKFAFLVYICCVLSLKLGKTHVCFRLLFDLLQVARDLI